VEAEQSVIVRLSVFAVFSFPRRRIRIEDSEYTTRIRLSGTWTPSPDVF
jgi:hypothetical protein